LRYYRDLVRLIYPENCIVCETELTVEDSCCCGFCIMELPYTYYERFTEPTALDQLFWGRVPIEMTFSLMYFEKGSASQKILHELKYGNNSKLGIRMGNLIGEQIKHTSAFNTIELLIPVPIHHRKKFTRGYNQSCLLAKGISQTAGIPLNERIIQKNEHTASQTRKGRFLRWDNVKEQFSIKEPLNEQVRHVAFVDDVITTGATLESLIRVFQEKYPDIHVSVISLAVTK